MGCNWKPWGAGRVGRAHGEGIDMVSCACRHGLLLTPSLCYVLLSIGDSSAAGQAQGTGREGVMGADEPGPSVAPLVTGPGTEEAGMVAGAGAVILATLRALGGAAPGEAAAIREVERRMDAWAGWMLGILTRSACCVWALQGDFGICLEWQGHAGRVR